MKAIYSILFFTLLSANSFSQIIELNLIAGNFNTPVELVNAGDDRLFIVEKSGVIRIINSDGTVNATPFLNISNIVGSGGERGLLGLAFAPDYQSSGRFYVNYTDNTSTNQPNTIIARYTVSSNPDIANTTGATLLTIPQPYNNHNGGKLAFGADNFLYIATGDGGDGGDPGNRSQNTNTLLGKILRIDVSGANYTIPADNPYITSGGLPEIYAIGLRNPWKLSFDRNNGDLWVADVGQSSYEEINKSVGSGTPGDNYGWRCYEGLHDFNNESTCPPMANTKTPVSEYNYGNGPNGFRCSITGGYVYHGSMYPSFIGKYFFADYCSAEIGMLTNNGGTWTTEWQLPTTNWSWSSFGEDVNGELYVVGGNAVYRITDSILSVTEEELSRNIKLYPNPSNGEVTIDLGSNFQDIESLNITNVHGQKVINRNTIETSSINFSTENLANGIYFAEINTFSGRKLVKKLVIN